MNRGSGISSKKQGCSSRYTVPPDPRRRCCAKRLLFFRRNALARNRNLFDATARSGPKLATGRAVIQKFQPCSAAQRCHRLAGPCCERRPLQQCGELLRWCDVQLRERCATVAIPSPRARHAPNRPQRERRNSREKHVPRRRLRHPGRRCRLLKIVKFFERSGGPAHSLFLKNEACPNRWRSWRDTSAAVLIGNTGMPNSLCQARMVWILRSDALAMLLRALSRPNGSSTCNWPSLTTSWSAAGHFTASGSKTKQQTTSLDCERRRSRSRVAASAPSKSLAITTSASWRHTPEAARSTSFSRAGVERAGESPRNALFWRAMTSRIRNTFPRLRWMRTASVAVSLKTNAPTRSPC